MANVDRSRRNTNLLIWHRSLWAIDHGACLRFHHSWGDPQRFAESAYDYGDHVLGGFGRPRDVHDAAERGGHPGAAGVDPDRGPGRLAGAGRDPARSRRPRRTRPSARERYVEFLLARLAAADRWLP